MERSAEGCHDGTRLQTCDGAAAEIDVLVERSRKTSVTARVSR